MGVERLLERFVDATAIETHWLAIIWQQCNQDNISEVDVLAQVLADLNCFDLANRKVNNDTIWIEAFCLDTGFETAGRNCDFERFLWW